MRRGFVIIEKKRCAYKKERERKHGKGCEISVCTEVQRKCQKKEKIEFASKIFIFPGKYDDTKNDEAGDEMHKKSQCQWRCIKRKYRNKTKIKN